MIEYIKWIWIMIVLWIIYFKLAGIHDTLKEILKNVQKRNS